MTQLRLVPAACAVWGSALVVIVLRSWDIPWWAVGLAGFVLISATAVGLYAFDHGQAIISTSLATSSFLVATIRRIIVENTQIPATFQAVAAGSASISETGTLQQFHLAGYPAPLPVWSREHYAVRIGETVRVSGHSVDSDRIGLGNTLIIASDISTDTAPHALMTFADFVRGEFLQLCTRWIHDTSTALIPAMVFGDTSAQTPEFKQAFIDTNLAHLSAVSGANVAIVTATAAALTARFGPVWRNLAAAATLGIYVLIVGTDPSVIRAAAMGIVGIVAMFSHSRTTPLHVLSLIVIVLLHYDTHYATNMGFCLSVAATVGIIVIYPTLRVMIGRSKLPDIFVKALALALAAQLSTMPLVAGMQHEISLIGVAANIACAPVVAPITVLGLGAAVAASIGAGLRALPVDILTEPLAALLSGIGGVMLSIISPLAQWISLIAHSGAALPGAVITVPTSRAPLWALVIALWVVYLIYRARLGILLAIATAAVVIPSILAMNNHEISYHDKQIFRIATEEELLRLYPHHLPAGTAVVVVEEEGKPRNYPSALPNGIPVLYPNRDGPVRLYTDGTWHADSGRF
ncbi:MAG: ComEC/Rec2 family competence protein [Corynebacterium sp.]|uniref:ComEC/Rec2 family competence protein n=1 Tax=Corynebacterium sp. TaxID=1720 RepID=UPI0026DC05BB|nr:ComEC/Rec2 family competence protein [Corynebacterium sp.]MDO4761396.1 ComEC/Rec2 family competence protein [Corynebacterium sp.]